MMLSHSHDDSDRASAVQDADVRAVVDRACERIAPTWPLDRFIAVNPFWKWVEDPLPIVGARLTALSGTRLVMPRAWFRERWRSEEMQARHLEAAIEESQSRTTVAELVALMETEEPRAEARARVTTVADRRRDLAREVSWGDFVTHSISQFCASYFDEGQAKVAHDRTDGLYASFRRNAASDAGPALLMGFSGYAELAEKLPETAFETTAFTLDELGVASGEREAYLTSLLLDVNGWASWCAYLRWTARLAGEDDHHIAELLAVRLAWEWIVFRGSGDETTKRWRAAMAGWSKTDLAASASQAEDWLLQRALELAWQERACAALRRKAPTFPPPSARAFFCIDVRSEVFRRALEEQTPAIATSGFAGFFGLPVEYQPLGAAVAHPQLPGLLAPRLRVTDEGVKNDAVSRRRSTLSDDASWRSFKTSALSSFAFVESVGLSFATKLLGDAFAPRASHQLLEGVGSPRDDGPGPKPRLSTTVEGKALGVAERCDLAEGVLRAMSFTRDYPPIVALIGHGAQTRNNPHAAGLDCGACCGQTGEVNARAAAALLNDPEVRAALEGRGITIPTSTWFLPGLHNTTTDEVTFFDLDELPPAHALDVAKLRESFDRAAVRARRERAPRLGLGQLDDAGLLRALRHRAQDWAEVRPEWGLADNAAFVVAPRERTRGVDLGGRVFLHDYRAEDDAQGKVLELIMTAPMVVAHWINLQYYASTVDNRRYGSGNKVLHNVAGGHLGVFEGNGGDLRIGLPMQSLHDGERWMHTPLRLSVFIEASRAAIDVIVEKHATVRALVENGWVHLFQIDDASGQLHARRRDGWVKTAPNRREG